MGMKGEALGDNATSVWEKEENHFGDKDEHRESNHWLNNQYPLGASKHLDNSRQEDESLIKTFECVQCNYSTKYKTSLTRHIKEKHNKAKDWHCVECNFTTFRKEFLNTHLIKAHQKSLI